MSRTCIVLTTDSRYLFPTLVGAITARTHSDPSNTDVIVFCFGAEDGCLQSFRPAFARENVELAVLDPRVIEGASPMMARLFLHKFLPAEYDEILYMDGDILVNGSLNPLLRVCLPDGSFLAANDPISFILDEENAEGTGHRTRMQQFGISGEMMRSYFNSGVLRLRRHGWAEIGKKAWDFYCRFKGRSAFPDQDALNFAGWRSRMPMSMSWNFPVFMHNAQLGTSINPRVTHFMSAPKPWQGNFAPWDSDAQRPYRNALAKYPMLESYLHRLSPMRSLKYRLQQRYKQLTETVQWGWSPRREKILRYELLCFPIAETPSLTPVPASESLRNSQTTPHHA